MKKKEMKTKVMAVAMSATMAASICPAVPAMAVTKDQVAKDGTYTKTAHVTRTEDDDEDEWNEYDVRVALTVKDGKFSDIVVTPEFFGVIIPASLTETILLSATVYSTLLYNTFFGDTTALTVPVCPGFNNIVAAPAIFIPVACSPTLILHTAFARLFFFFIVILTLPAFFAFTLPLC